MKNIRKIIVQFLVCFFTLGASLVNAADLTGKWAGEGDQHDRIIEFTKAGKIIFYEEGVAGISGNYKKQDKIIKITIEKSEIGEVPSGMKFEWTILKQERDKLQISDERKQTSTFIKVRPNNGLQTDAPQAPRR